MKTQFKTILFAVLVALLAVSCFGQTAMTTTTLTRATGPNTTTFALASVTGVTAPQPNNSQRTVLFIGRSAYYVTSVSGLNVTVTRGVKGTYGNEAHLTGATVYVGPDTSQYFAGTGTVSSPAIRGACTAANIPILPVIDVFSGSAMTCAAGRWGVLREVLVDASNCTFIPTTLTTTNILTQVGTSGHMVVQGTSNAAAGTNTLTCNIPLPLGAQLVDINLFIGSQTTAPTSLGTATLATVTYPTANATETASVEVPVAIGGTVTTTSPTAITTVTTAGRFLTIGHTFATPVVMADNAQMIYQMPFLQSAAAAMVLNSPGVLVHYLTGPNSN